MPPDLARRVERQVRAYAEAPPDVNITIGKRTASSFNGFDNLPVTIEGNGVRKTVNFLLAKDGSKLLYMTELDLKEDPYARNMSRIDVSGRPFRGPENAPATVVVYDDFECPSCARMYVTLINAAMNQYRGRVKVVMKDFPLVEAHPWAMRAAVDAHCLADESLPAYWDFSDYVHTHQPEVSEKFRAGNGSPAAIDALAKEFGAKRPLKTEELQACLARQDQTKVQSSIAEGKSLGVGATPTLFFNGQEVEGVLTDESLRALLDRTLAEAAPAKSNP
ncbi:MAG TPA: thioredoxin domain-containing protein [Terriglobales bacterium]|nr:thioredoxin domain-containing protein [Terriglobales bacterium]